MFQVLEDNKPADATLLPRLKGLGWHKSKFDTWEEAETYALNWLGGFSPGLGILQLNVPYDYSGMGSMIEIREVE